MPILHHVHLKILHKHCFLFILGITVVSANFKTMLMQDIGGGGGGLVNRVYSDPFL